MAKRKRKNLFESEPPETKSIDTMEEANILGAMMVDKVFLLWCAKYHTTVDTFENDECKLLFTAIDSLRKERQPVDLLTVSERLRESGLIETITPVTLSNLTAIADVQKAYATMKKRIKVLEIPVYDINEEIKKNKKREYKTVIDFDANIEFRHFAGRFKLWVNNQEIKNCLQRLGSPETSVNDRQFCAGVLFAMKRFESIFESFLEDEKGVYLGINLYDLINQYDDWRNGEEVIQQAIPSKMNDSHYFNFEGKKVKIVVDDPVGDPPFMDEDIPF
jgi:hypothetical protein